MPARIVYLVLSVCLSTYCTAQSVSGYFESIRNNHAALTAFFAQMPKGGDLHHHFSGSVYAETFLDIALRRDYYLNRNTLYLAEQPGPGDWVKLSTLKASGDWPEYRQKLFQKWSVKDYNHVDSPSDKLFFSSFAYFSPIIRTEPDTGLLELKRRAKLENVSYIETIFSGVPCDTNLSDLYPLAPVLRQQQTRHDTTACLHLLDSLYTVISARGIRGCAVAFNRQTLERLHKQLQIDDAQFTMRYQNVVIRTLDQPVDLFRNMIAAFESAADSPLIVGVNIAAPEDNETALADYWLHMLMFKYCHAKYPRVKITLHAGELALGLVKPEDLNWHIGAAIHVAGASRIGHGVAIPYETNCYDLLRYMRQHNIAVEINLFSNEFILNVKDDKHPITLYRSFGVPLVICTDDAGVLRTNLTDQYVLLAKRYRNLTYNEIKQLVFNSITYSFIEEESVKKALLADLKQRFIAFEKSVPVGARAAK